MQERIRIGACEDCDVKIRLPQGASSTGPVIELARTNGIYRIASIDPNLEVKLNGRSIKPEKGIHDGDEIWIGPSGPSIHFFPIASTPALVPGRRDGAHVAPFIEQAAMEASATARRDDAKIFLREFTRELVREINPSTKIITFAILILAVVGGLYIGFAQFNEARRGRRIIADQQAQLVAQQQEMERANAKLQRLLDSTTRIQNTIAMGEMMKATFGDGVCLIYGSFNFVESGTGRPLRYPETQTNESGTTVQNASEESVLTPEGHGAVAEFPFAGTGFHVGDGFVLTNRHVTQPWEADERAQSLNSTVRGVPRLKKFVAFFPGKTQPIALKVKQASRSEDLAVCLIDAKDLLPKIPVLPLEKDPGSVAVGKLVVTMGYPSGTGPPAGAIGRERSPWDSTAIWFGRGPAWLFGREKTDSTFDDPGQHYRSQSGANCLRRAHGRGWVRSPTLWAIRPSDRRHVRDFHGEHSFKFRRADTLCHYSAGKIRMDRRSGSANRSKRSGRG